MMRKLLYAAMTVLFLSIAVLPATADDGVKEKIISKIFERGAITGITDHQMVEFVKSRLNLCLKNLGLEPLYEVKYNPISSWFYKGINSIQLHDFFYRVGNEYHRSWEEEGFKW